jgi:hypothetical protein
MGGETAARIRPGRLHAGQRRQRRALHWRKPPYDGVVRGDAKPAVIAIRGIAGELPGRRSAGTQCAAALISVRNRPIGYPPTLWISRWADQLQQSEMPVNPCVSAHAESLGSTLSY